MVNPRSKIKKAEFSKQTERIPKKKLINQILNTENDEIPKSINFEDFLPNTI